MGIQTKGVGMGWGDDVTRAQVKVTLDLLREGEEEFRNLVAVDDDQLADKLAALDPKLLRSIVFERVIAARYRRDREPES
jgi:hypothetical protein